MDKYLVLDTVVPAVTLVNQEYYAVDSEGAKTTTLGQWAKGVVSEGHVADEGSVIVIHGECTAKVFGADSNVSKDDALCAGSAGVFKKATVGTHDVRAYALEDVTTDTTALIFLN